MQKSNKKLLILFFCLALVLPILLMAIAAVCLVAAMRPAETSAEPTEISSPADSTYQTPTPETTTPETTAPETTTTPGSTPTPDARISPEDYKAFYPEKKVVAFTFDDGPGDGTQIILDEVAETGDRVTFFINGYRFDLRPDEYAEYVRRGLEAGCEYGSHTYNHTSLYDPKSGSIDSEKIYDELNDLQLKYRSITGETMSLMRPPGGSFDKNRRYGYAVIHWSVDSEDWRSNSKYKSALSSSDEETRKEAEEKAVDEIVSKVLSQVRSGDIILMHDLYRVSALAFKRMAVELKAQGYELVTVSELLQIDAAEYDGWYFHSTYSCGHDGIVDVAAPPASEPTGPATETASLPPTKTDGE